MKVQILEFSPSGKNTAHANPKHVFTYSILLLFVTFIPLFLLSSLHFPMQIKLASSNSTIVQIVKQCDLSSGEWIPDERGPYYTNSTCREIIDQQNCLKFGRPDNGFLKWRWKPHECDLPIFDAVQFLELVRGKSLAFAGDSVARNQLQSLICLLASVEYPEDATDYSAPMNNMSDVGRMKYRRWFYSNYNFTLAAFWSPFLVKTKDADAAVHTSNFLQLYLDEPDEVWPGEIENFDYVIISGGQWFFRPLYLYEKGKLVGCHLCKEENVTVVSTFDVYRMAFRTAFRAVEGLKGYKGMTFLRTFSPSHFENGEWNTGGSCARTRPFTSKEMQVQWYQMQLYMAQVSEFRDAEQQGRSRGLKFRLLDTTSAMVLRPDGHPNHYGHSPEANITFADCVHWCLPGPIDTWNEILLHILKMEDELSFDQKLQILFDEPQL